MHSVLKDFFFFFFFFAFAEKGILIDFYIITGSQMQQNHKEDQSNPMHYSF